MTSSEDFIAGPIGDFGVEVTRTPVTMTTNFHGQKDYSEGTSETITVVFSNPNTNYVLDKAGLTKIYDAIVYVKSDQTINKYDKITHKSKDYRVNSVSDRYFDGNIAYKVVGLFYINE